MKIFSLKNKIFSALALALGLLAFGTAVSADGFATDKKYSFSENAG